jgi:RNA polymerase sigma-70 factor (ECF subfamily)
MLVSFASEAGGAVAEVSAAMWVPPTWEEVVREHSARVYRLAYRLSGNQQDAEDLTATTFGKALASLDCYTEQGSFAAWLFGIARHTLLDYRRRQRPRLDLEHAASLRAPAGEPEAHALRTERRAELERLVRLLPPEQQEALLLRFVAGLRGGEAAAVLGRSEGAVRMLVHRAVSALRTQLAEEEGS